MSNICQKLCLGIALCLAAAGCTPEGDAASVDVDYGKSLYDEKCAQCHGAGGVGAGPASLGLGAPPPALTGLSQRFDGVFPRDYVLNVIDGYSRRDHPTAAMPEFGAEDLGDTIIVESDGLATPIPADLLALANYLESIQE